MLMEAEGGMTFRGPTALGVNAILEIDDGERKALLRTGEQLLEQGCVSHNYLEFYEYAIADYNGNVGLYIYQTGEQIVAAPCTAIASQQNSPAAAVLPQQK